jgi:hypothetical protein
MRNRRNFIALLGGAAVARPHVARVQQLMPLIGFLHSELPNDRAPLLGAGPRRG